MFQVLITHAKYLYYTFTGPMGNFKPLMLLMNFFNAVSKEPRKLDKQPEIFPGSLVWTR